MDIQFLRTFIEVARIRHFGKAAENLYLTQSAVSARIKFLEEAIGEPLFIRERNNIQLTSVGEKLMPYAEGIVNLWSRAKQEVLLNDQSENLLSVSCAPGIWEIILHHWLIQLAKSKLSISVNSNVLPILDIFQKLGDCTLDLGFTFEPPADPGLVIKEVATVPVILVSSTNNQDISKAIADRFIYVDWGTSINTDLSNQWGDKIKPVFKLAQNHLALSLLLSHGGAAFIAEQTARKHIDEGRLFMVDESPVYERTVYAVYSEKSINKNIIKKSLNLFQKIEQIAHPDINNDEI
tara:strand:+ start:475 stop:1356 length:882 start_codon:yes stop_codon:yes gene_type:complete